MRPILILGILLCTSLSLFGQAQEFDKELLDAYFDKIESSDRCMLSVAIHKNGHLLYSRALGFSEIESNSKADISTEYRIGSISKTYTAVLVLKQIENGKLSLDDKLSEFYPDLPSASEITIEQLLRHRTGLHNFTNDEDYFSYNEKAQTKEQMLNRFKEKGSDFTPGTKMSYSNTNYVILSYILEDLSNKPFAELLDDEIVKPLKLKHTRFINGVDASANQAMPYERVGKWMPYGITHGTVPLGAGGIQSTPEDLNTFFFALFNNQLINSESLEKMTEMVEGYGLGVFTFPYNEKRAFGHTGGIDTYQSMAGHFPEDNLTLSAITNGCSLSLNDAMISMIKSSFGEEYELPVFEKELSYSDDELQKMSGVYSSPLFPLKITINPKGGGLVAQATGQPEFALESTSLNVFEFKQAGIKMIFKPEENKMTFVQGQSFEMNKEE